jgi:GNAT superfamily N-acetyltransferase
VNCDLAHLLFSVSDEKFGTPLDAARKAMGESAKDWAWFGAGGSGEQWWAFATGGDSPDVNMALIASRETAAVDSALQIFSNANVPGNIMLASAGLAHVSYLESFGFVGVGVIPFMAKNLEINPAFNLDPPQLKLVRAKTQSELDAVIELEADSYKLSVENCKTLINMKIASKSNVAYWLLVDGDTPVSTVASGRVGTTSGIWNMGTPQQYQKKGYGKALLTSVLNTLAGEGQKLALLWATPDGESLYRNIGFEVVEYWQSFIPKIL